jgi:flagellin-like protein
MQGSSTRGSFFGNGEKRSRRAISPVIATVILVALSVVIAASLSGFAGSLFGTYSQSPQIKIRDATFSNSGSTVTINFVNAGSAADTVIAVSCPFGGTTLTANGDNLSPSPATIQPNTTTQVVATFSGAMPMVGQQVTLTALTSDGSTQTFSVIVTA